MKEEENEHWRVEHPLSALMRSDLLALGRKGGIPSVNNKVFGVYVGRWRYEPHGNLSCRETASLQMRVRPTALSLGPESSYAV